MSRANILVVDDQDSIRHFVGKALLEEGFEVKTAGSVRETRPLLEQGTPDVAILDLKLPDGTGLELLREIKRVDLGAAVIVMTAFGELETAVEAMNAGAFWFVKKRSRTRSCWRWCAGRSRPRRPESSSAARHQAFADENFLHSTSPRCRRPTPSPSRSPSVTPPAC